MQSSHSHPGGEEGKVREKGLSFLSPLSHLSLTKVVKCFPIRLLSQIFTLGGSRGQERRGLLAKVPTHCHFFSNCGSRIHYLAMDNQSLCHSSEARIRRWHYLMMSILTPKSKNMGKVREREGTSREVRTYGGRQHEATTGSSAAASSAPGKKWTSQEIYS